MIKELVEQHPHLPLIAWLSLGLISYFVGTRVLTPLIQTFTEKTKAKWDDVLTEAGVIRTIAHLIPANLLQATLPMVWKSGTPQADNVTTILNVYLILTGLMLVLRLMSAAVRIYESIPRPSYFPFKSIVQAAGVVFSVLAIILVIAQITHKSPLYLLSGLGALTAILLLVFKDSILGLVAGIQLSVQDLVRKGDWIEMPKHGADGDVIDITLTTVRVQNWDRTISAIPAYELVSSSFKNWRGMSDSGGRRIKRPISIDTASIRFLAQEEIRELMKIQRLEAYLHQKLEEIAEHNTSLGLAADATPVNGRRLTNVGTFRAYCREYLKNHPQIHASTPGLSFLVRQLEPGPQGLPIELYVFTRDTRWAYYEDIQADIFDHLYAVLPLFGLRAFQQPSGHDIVALGATLGKASPPQRPQLS